MYAKNSVVKIENTVIENNNVRYGAGIYVKNSDVTITNSKISSNDASIDGGGLYIYDGTCILHQSTLSNNDATNNGDEIYISGSPSISLINTYFSNSNNNNNIYEFNGSPTWKTCADNLCTDVSYTGTCSAVDNNDVNLGVNEKGPDINLNTTTMTTTGNLKTTEFYLGGVQVTSDAAYLEYVDWSQF